MIPGFLTVYRGMREEQLATYTLAVKCGTTPAMALESCRERVSANVRFFKQRMRRNPFHGRRLGATVKLLRAIERGQGQQVKMGGG